MSSQGLETIDHTVHLTHEWINELAARLGWGSKRGVFHLMRVTFRTLRDYLPPDEMAQLSAQLPLLIRGCFFEGWRPKATQFRDHEEGAFIASIQRERNEIPEYEGPEDISAVFALLNNRISLGELQDIRGTMPSDVLALWPDP